MENHAVMENLGIKDKQTIRESSNSPTHLAKNAKNAQDKKRSRMSLERISL
jgi:hypothetical protein